MLSTIALIIVSGLAHGVPYFLVALGLTLIVGIMGVLNFAQGGYLMLAAYFLTTLIRSQEPNLASFVGGVIGAVVVAAVVAVITERAAFQRIYGGGRDALSGLLLSFGLLLLLTGIIMAVWGTGNRAQGVPAELSGHVAIGTAAVSVYSVFMLAVGAAVAGGLYLMLQKTQLGRVFTAVSFDRTMAAALGVSPAMIYMTAFVIAGALGGIAGALIGPMGAINSDLGPSYLFYGFAAIVVGGMGSIPGAVVGSLLIGLVESTLVNYVPWLQPYGVYMVVAAVLLVRPRGLFPTRQAEMSR